MNPNNHDSLCEMSRTGCKCTWVSTYGKSCDLCYCLCDEIRAAREDERRAILGSQPPPPSTPPLPPPRHRTEHNSLCLEGLTSDEAVSVEALVPAEDCEHCRLIDLAAERERAAIVDKFSWECGDCGNTYGPDVAECPNEIRDSIAAAVSFRGHLHE